MKSYLDCKYLVQFMLSWTYRVFKGIIFIPRIGNHRLHLPSIPTTQTFQFVFMTVPLATLGVEQWRSTKLLVKALHRLCRNRSMLHVLYTLNIPDSTFSPCKQSGHFYSALLHVTCVIFEPTRPLSLQLRNHK